MILNQAEAKAIYDAIIALNKVDFWAFHMNSSYAIVKKAFNGSIVVRGVLDDEEYYDNQNAFAYAYGIINA